MNSKTPIDRPWWQRWEVVLVTASVAVAVAFAIAMVALASIKPLSPLETTLFQIVILLISLGGGLFGSYKFGQNSVANRHHARSALRSVIMLHRGILQLSRNLASLNARRPDRRFDQLQHFVQLLLIASLTAIEDWRDVIPDDFEDVGDRFEQPEPGRRDPENDGPNRTDSR